MAKMSDAALLQLGHDEATLRILPGLAVTLRNLSQSPSANAACCPGRQLLPAEQLRLAAIKSALCNTGAAQLRALKTLLGVATLEFTVRTSAGKHRVNL